MSLVVPVLLAWVAWAGVAFLLQRRILFPGRIREAPSPPGRSSGPPQGVEALRLHVGDDGEVEAWYLQGDGRSADSPGAALLFAHGNAELVDDWVAPFGSFARRGVGVLLVEFPGYGRSPGTPTEASVTRAMVAGFDLLAARPEVDPVRIVAVGRSLGGGGAAALTRHRPVAALVLLSTFLGVRPLARRMLVPGFLVRDPFDNAGAVASYRGPVLVGHGRRDAVVPFEHGRALSRLAADGRFLAWDAGHDDAPPDWDAFTETVLAFLSSHDLLPPGPAAGGAARFFQ